MCCFRAHWFYVWFYDGTYFAKPSQYHRISVWFCFTDLYASSYHSTNSYWRVLKRGVFLEISLCISVSILYNMARLLWGARKLWERRRCCRVPCEIFTIQVRPDNYSGTTLVRSPTGHKKTGRVDEVAALKGLFTKENVWVGALTELSFRPEFSGRNHEVTVLKGRL